MRIFILLLLLSACTKPAESSVPAGSKFVVERLFTVDGCTVYRFRDDRNVYFTNCVGATKWIEACGKNCVRDIEVN